MHALETEIEYVTAIIGEQLFGLPISRVLDVFAVERMTRVPLAPPEIAGVLNLRGRVITAIDMRRRLSVAAEKREGKLMAIGIEHRGEHYGLIVDAIGEVLKLPAAGREANPMNLDRAWAAVSDGVQKLEDRLLVILNVDRILDLQPKSQAA